MQCCRGLREGLRGAFAPAELVLHGEYRRTSDIIRWDKPMPRASDILVGPGAVQVDSIKTRVESVHGCSLSA